MSPVSHHFHFFFFVALSRSYVAPSSALVYHTTSKYNQNTQTYPQHVPIEHYHVEVITIFV